MGAACIFLLLLDVVFFVYNPLRTFWYSIWYGMVFNVHSTKLFYQCHFHVLHFLLVVNSSKLHTLSKTRTLPSSIAIPSRSIEAPFKDRSHLFHYYFRAWFRICLKFVSKLKRTYVSMVLFINFSSIVDLCVCWPIEHLNTPESYIYIRIPPPNYVRLEMKNSNFFAFFRSSFFPQIDWPIFQTEQSKYNVKIANEPNTIYWKGEFCKNVHKVHESSIHPQRYSNHALFTGTVPWLSDPRLFPLLRMFLLMYNARNCQIEPWGGAMMKKHRPNDGCNMFAKHSTPTTWTKTFDRLNTLRNNQIWFTIVCLVKNRHLAAILPINK